MGRRASVPWVSEDEGLLACEYSEERESCIPRLRDCILNWKFKTFCHRYPLYISSVQLSPSVDTFPELQRTVTAEAQTFLDDGRQPEVRPILF